MNSEGLWWEVEDRHGSIDVYYDLSTANVKYLRLRSEFDSTPGAITYRKYLGETCVEEYKYVYH